MKLNDVMKITRQMVAETFGETYMTENGYLESIPVDKLVDIGKALDDSEYTAERATKALCVLLAKREIYEGDFTPLYKSILVDRVEWGGFIERDKIDFADIMDDPVFNVTNGVSYADIEHKYYQPKVHSKIFSEGKAIMIPISIQRSTLTEAFRDYDTMNAFISKIQSKVRQTLDLAIDRYCAGLVIGAIAVSTKATKTAVYLLSDAIADGVKGIDDTTTPSQAMANPDYILYIAKRIAEIKDNMKVPSVAYNNGNIPIATRDTITYLSTHFDRTLKFDVKSNVFNRSDVDFGNYESIPMWQSVKESTGNTFDYDAATTVSLSADPTNKLGIGTDAVEISNVLGLTFDRKALGLTIFKEYTTNSYTACADFWNEFIHSVTNQILDSDFPIVAFINDKKPTE